MTTLKTPFVAFESFNLNVCADSFSCVGFHQSEYHGLLKEWSNSDVQRLLHMLVLEEYLRETLIFVRDIPLAYLKIGVNVDKLMSGQKRIEFAVENVKAKKGKKADVNLKDNGPCTATSEALKDLYEKCYNDLLQKCRDIAQARNMTVGSVMNNEALKKMAELLPTTEEEMRKITYVTKANFDKFGEQLLETLQHYAGEKALVELDMDTLQSEINETFSDDDGDTTNWNSLAAGANSSGAGSGAQKRKRAFGGGYRRKKRVGTPKRRRTTAKKATKTGAAAVKRGANKTNLLKPRVFT